MRNTFDGYRENISVLNNSNRVTSEMKLNCVSNYLPKGRKCFSLSLFMYVMYVCYVGVHHPFKIITDSL